VGKKRGGQASKKRGEGLGVEEKLIDCAVTRVQGVVEGVVENGKESTLGPKERFLWRGE